MMYKVVISSNFKKQYKKIRKQGKDLKKLKVVVNQLAIVEKLDSKYKDHPLVNDKYYKDCRDVISLPIGY